MNINPLSNCFQFFKTFLMLMPRPVFFFFTTILAIFVVIAFFRIFSK